MKVHLTVTVICLCGLLAQSVVEAQTRREEILRQAEFYKQQRDWANMEAVLKVAIQQLGMKDEYFMRGLSWAQMLQGKTEEAVQVARENVRLNPCAWSLQQLADAARAHGDLNTAREALRSVTRLDLLQDPSAMEALRRTAQAVGDPDFLAQLNAVAQETRLPTMEVFEDFESSGYNGWTLEGNCWGSAPATERTFPGQVTGWRGDFYANTFHPQHSGTGKATSRPFRIAQPYVHFLIGGGKYPGQCCLNLVVDGKIAQTATGNNAAVLFPVIWDVREWMGKEARLEIVDQRIAPPMGCVMVDRVVFADTPNTAQTIGYPRLKAALLAGAENPGEGGQFAAAFEKSLEPFVRLFREKGLRVYAYGDRNGNRQAIIEALRSDHFVVYCGHGNSETGGFAAKGYGGSAAQLARELRLAPGAVVFYLGACGATGGAYGETGKVSLALAQRRVATFSDPFMSLGSAAYVAFGPWSPDSALRSVRHLLDGGTLGEVYLIGGNVNKRCVSAGFHPRFPQQRMWIHSIETDEGLDYNAAFVGDPDKTLADLFGNAPRVGRSQ
jgi:hypothetical protein